MAYDIYSLGLVLAEIVSWKPLKSIARDFLGQLNQFGTTEATQLRTKIIEQVRRELAFRMGTAYRDAVEWCLTCKEDTVGCERDLATQFFAHVVVPLENVLSMRK